MMRLKIVILFLALTVFSSFSYADPPQEVLSLQEAFVEVSKKVGSSVVTISTEYTERYQTVRYPFSQFEDEFFKDFFDDFFILGPEREFKRTGLGSGVIIDENGHILTNEHVVHGAEKITVTLPDGREYEGRLSGSDVYSDLAVIKIEPKGNLPFAVLGDSDKVQIGQWAIAIGNPFGFAVRNPEPTVTVGVIGALHRSLPRTDKRAREYSDLMQTDAAINPGNSGGPLLNIYGEVIGINVAIFTLSGGSEGIGFAIPINTAKRVVNDLIEGRNILHGWIGVVIQDLDNNLIKYFGLKERQGVLISMIVKGSPAEKGGLKTGDVITSFDNERIKNTHDLIRRVLKKDIGDKITLGIIRDKTLSFLKVEIGVSPGEQKTETFTGQKPKVAEPQEVKHWRGIEVSEITREIASRFKLALESGVIVARVEPLSPAQEAGIREGDVIYEIDRKPIHNIEDYRAAIKKISGGDVLVGTFRGYVVIKEK